MFLTVGNFIVDEVYDLDEFPKEDTKVRAKSYSLSAGGNAANVAFMLKKLLSTTTPPLATPPNVFICAVIGDDSLGSFLEQECLLRGIFKTFLIQPCKQETSKTVVLRNTPSRTCIHLKSCPEVDYDTFHKVFSRATTNNSITAAEDDGFWVHFEGRNTAETRRMMDFVLAASPRNRISLELERSRTGDEHTLLCTSPRIAVFSSQYVSSFGYDYDTASQFFHHLVDDLGLGPKLTPALWVITFGSRGSIGALIHPQQQQLGKRITCFHVAAKEPVTVVDSLGAGDCFMAGLIYSVSQSNDLQSGREHVEFATQVAINKLQRLGI